MNFKIETENTLNDDENAYTCFNCNNKTLKYREIQFLLEHLSLQNDAFSSSNKQLMIIYKQLQIQMNYLMNLIGIISYITTEPFNNSDPYPDFKEILPTISTTYSTKSCESNIDLENYDYNYKELLNNSKLLWFQTFYNILEFYLEKEEYTCNKFRARLIQDEIKPLYFELNLKVESCEEVNSDSVVNLIHNEIIKTADTVQNSDYIKEILRNILNFLCEDKITFCNVILYSDDNNIVKYKNYYFQNKIESQSAFIFGICKKNMIYGDFFSDFNSFRYIEFSKSIIYNKTNQRFLICNKSKELCWSDRVNDINQHLIEDFSFLFVLENSNIKLYNSIILCFNNILSRLISGYLESSNDSENFDRSNIFEFNHMKIPSPCSKFLNKFIAILNTICPINNYKSYYNQYKRKSSFDNNTEYNSEFYPKNIDTFNNDKEKYQNEILKRQETLSDCDIDNMTTVSDFISSYRTAEDNIDSTYTFLLEDFFLKDTYSEFPNSEWIILD
ncbi:hypothetical protein ACR3K2_27940 [Cryptosporidium serpentis]